jgi:RND superfamily putative drug exporter
VLKLLGLGLATAIFIDATIVRMVLVPSTMELLGNANWWLPKWLDRIVPRVSIEAPPELAKPAPAKSTRPTTPRKKTSAKRTAPKKRKPTSKPSAKKGSKSTTRKR